jgi:phosphonate transport system permease protein
VLKNVLTGRLAGMPGVAAAPTLVVVFGVLPQVIPSWIAWTLYRFEVNLRAATILGMGARAASASS